MAAAVEREAGPDRRADIRRAKGRDAANEFYRAHQVEMDEGASIAWPARFDAKSGETQWEVAIPRSGTAGVSRIVPRTAPGTTSSPWATAGTKCHRIA